MRLGILTSSRADYGIYLPLLKKLKDDDYFIMEIIAFGTHLSKCHGYTLDEIKNDGYTHIHEISSLIANDDEQSIATSYGLTVIKFANFWDCNKYDLVLCLGDRFEMSAAVQAGVPFGIKFAHLHGGEITLGAIDNIYRHQITLASILHFTSADQFTERVIQLIGNSNKVFNVGSLSLDNIEYFKPIERFEFLQKFKIPNREFALITFHPETINPNSNKLAANEMRKALNILSKQMFLVVTMPNADTMGSIFRKEIEHLINESPDCVLCIENFGKFNYFNAMYYSRILIGNTSSGILEAASFGKYVVNVGDRQKGRLQSGNIINSTFDKNDIIQSVEKALSKINYSGVNIYYKKNPVESIINHLKKFNEIL
jgi:GDP/UDP-N,N'-diacetylbacillosamine 2-epimerase (hydrolysing)